MDSSVSQPILNEESLYTYTTISSGPPKKRAGRTKFRETRHPVYKGVRRRGSNGSRWVCEVREPNKKSRIWLGTFPTPEMAARAHDVAAMQLRGRKACLNFADSGWRLRPPSSGSHEDIRAAAVVAAEMFRPATNVGDGDVSLSGEKLVVLSESEEDVGDGDEKPSLTTLVDAVEIGGDWYLDSFIRQFGSYDYGWDVESESVADVSLWSYSI